MACRQRSGARRNRRSWPGPTTRVGGASVERLISSATERVDARAAGLRCRDAALAPMTLFRIASCWTRRPTRGADVRNTSFDRHADRRRHPRTRSRWGVVLLASLAVALFGVFVPSASAHFAGFTGGVEYWPYL